MIRRLFITSDAVGGVWRYSLTLASALAARGIAVRIGVVGPPPSAAQAAEVTALAGVDTMAVDAPLDWLAGSQAELDRARRAIWRSATRWGAQVIQVNQPAFAGGGSGMPTVVVAHSSVETWWRGTHGTPAPSEWHWHREAVRQGLDAADAVVAPTRAFADMLMQVYGLTRSPLAIWNDVPRRHVAAVGIRGHHFLASGRAWDESKNFALLNEAAPYLPWPVRLAGAYVAPEGGEAVRLPTLVRLGQLDAASMAAEYAAAPVYVAPSLHEPFGLGVVEAAQAGAALLLSDIPSFRELWDGAALFFDPRDRGDLIRAARRLADDPALRARLSEAARQRAAAFGMERGADAMIEVYRGATRRADTARVA